MIKKVLLVQPPYTIHKADPKGCQPPLGLAYIAAVLEQNGLAVEILDAVVEGFDHEVDLGEALIRYGLDFPQIEAAIGKSAPDLVGVSCLFSSQHENALEVARIVKGQFPDCPVVFGGAHPSVACGQVMENESVDFVVIGEGEYSFRDLINALNAENDYSAVDGLAWRQAGIVKVNPKTRFIDNLDEVPFPARHLLPMEKYFQINRPHGTTSKLAPNTSMITSRGCPARCVFCSIHSVWGRRFRPRSPENVVQEIRQLKNKYGIKELQFEDDNLTFNRSRAKRIFGLLCDEGLDLLWTTPNGIAAYAIDEELIEIMKKSGCYRVCLAIESGDEYVLHKIIKKPLKLEKVKPLVKKFRQTGIAVDGFFVVGFPGETKEQIRTTFNFALRVGFDNVNFFVATPYPGTELYDICEEKGYLPKGFSFNKLKVSNANISTPEFSGPELEKIIAKETLKYRLKQLRNPALFYDRVIRRFLKDPRFFVSYLRRLVGRMTARPN